MTFRSLEIRKSALPQLVLGLALIAVSWSASWSGETSLAHHSFFALWFGYILTVDSLVLLRSGGSLFRRDSRCFTLLFVCSVPLWWIFEALNARLDNWHYLLPGPRSWLGYHLEASLAFSTVVPAVFETAELIRTFPFFARNRRWLKLTLLERGWPWFSIAGAAMLGLVLAWPDLFFPLAWISLFFLVDPLVYRLGGRSVASQVLKGRWDTVLVLFAAGLTCGFFWEMWNWRAMPKWEYDIPFAERFHLFEMPILGYGGYLPFALETYAVVMLLDRLFGLFPPEYLRFDAAPERAPL